MTRKYFWSIILSCGIVLVAFLLTGQARLWGQGFGQSGISIAASDSLVYRLEVGGMTPDLFDECSGLGSSSDIEQQKIVTERGVVAWQASPGALHWDSITLTRDSLGNGQIWQWRKAVEEGRLAEAFKTGSIVLVGSSSSQVYARWTFRNGWPARVSFNEGAEELVIVHDGLEFAGASSGGGISVGVKKR